MFSWSIQSTNEDSLPCLSFKPWAGLLKDAGLNRITVSLDSLDSETCALMSDVKLPIERVLNPDYALSGLGRSA